MTEMYDKNARQIYAGDLLRSLHFIGARKKRYYLYHVAVTAKHGLEAVPVCYLEPSKAADGGGRCLITKQCEGMFEIIHGCGPEPYLGFEDRPRQPTSPAGKEAK